MHFDDEFFGTADKIALIRRGAAIKRLVADDPRFAWYGRAVAASGTVEDAAELMTALARLQGAGVCYFYPKAQADDLYAELARRGLATDRHEHFLGREDAMAESRAALDRHALPKDLRVMRIGPDTPGEVVAATAALQQSCGVMPVPGAVMRGGVVRGICLVALDENGQPAATASSYMLHHPANRHGDVAFWGMLATRGDRRGEKIALILGAQAMLHMWDAQGARGFMTGVRADNASSKALCNRLGVQDTEWIYAQCFDEAVLGGVGLTR